MKLRLLCESDDEFLKMTYWHVSIPLYHQDYIDLPDISNKELQFKIISSLWSASSHGEGLNIDERYDKIIKLLDRIRLVTWMRISHWPGLFILPRKDSSFHDDDEFNSYFDHDNVKAIISNKEIEFCSVTKDECYQHTLNPSTVSVLQNKIKVIESSLKDTLDTFVKNYKTR